MCVVTRIRHVVIITIHVTELWMLWRFVYMSRNLQ